MSDKTIAIAREALETRKQNRRKQSPAEIVQKMYTMNFDGNIIPHSWFEHLKRENGKPYAVAAILLSEIAYWYRPTAVKDETTGKVIRLQKRYKADKLQRGYGSFADQFGFTKRQVKDALKYLEGLGIIDLDFRDIPIKDGTLGNVLFIGLDPDRLAAITYQIMTSDEITSDPPPSDEITSEVCRNNVRGLTEERQTNTEITTEVTTEVTFPNSNPTPSPEIDNWEEPEIKSELVEAAVKEISQEFGDLHHLNSNVQQAYNIWEANGFYLGEEDFVAKMREAADTVRDLLAAGKVKDEDKAMAYFFKVFRSRVVRR